MIRRNSAYAAQNGQNRGISRVASTQNIKFNGAPTRTKSVNLNRPGPWIMVLTWCPTGVMKVTEPAKATAMSSGRGSMAIEWAVTMAIVASSAAAALFDTISVNSECTLIGSSTNILGAAEHGG